MLSIRHELVLRDSPAIVALNESGSGRRETQLDYAQRDSSDRSSEIRGSHKGQLHNSAYSGAVDLSARSHRCAISSERKDTSGTESNLVNRQRSKHSAV